MSGCWERSVSPLGSPWGSPWGPQGEKNELLQFHSKHSQKLIPSAHTLCDPGIKVWEQSDTWLWRTKFFPSGGPMGAPCLGGPKGRPKSTSSVSTKTLPKLDTICAYTMRIYCESLEEIGLVVVEKECFPSWGSPWGPQGEPPHGEKNKLLQLWPKHSQNLIPYADTLCASSIKVWRCLDQWFVRKLMFSSVALFL